MLIEIKHSNTVKFSISEKGLLCYRKAIKCNVCKSLPSPFDSILEAVLTVSPNKQYRGIVMPTTPATTGPGEEKNSVHKKSWLQEGNNAKYLSIITFCLLFY